MELSKMEESVQCLDKAIELNTSNSKVYYAKGLYLKEKKI